MKLQKTYPHLDYIPYGRQNITEEDIKAVVKILKSSNLTQGPKVAEFESALCNLTGASFAIMVNSGTSALHIASLAAEINEGDEVITSPITFVASANCVLYCRGEPVFADIQPDTVNIDPLEIRNKITKRTRAIIPVDFAGHPCDLEEIYNIAKAHNLIVIEDAAHALGAEYKGSKIGSCKYSDMTIFSFHPVKHITTGEGGAVLTNKKDLYEKLLMLRSHGITKENNKVTHFDSPWYYEQQLLGFNYRITDIQCALGISQLRKLDVFIQKRKEIVEMYNDAFKNIEEITIPYEKPEAKPSWHLYVVRLKLDKLKTERKEIFDTLRRQNIYVQVHYIPVYWQPYYQRLGYQKGICPEAERYYEETITLPLFPGMGYENVNKVIDALKEVIHKTPNGRKG